MKPLDRHFRSGLLLLAIIPILTGFHWWDPVARWMGIGNETMESGNLDSARDAYQKAAELAPGDERIANNLGLLEYSSENFDAAVKEFEAAATSRDGEVRAQALYNKGCTLMKKGDLQGSVQSFIDALKANPDDRDAKINLEMALQMMQNMPTPTPSEGQDSEQDQQSTGTPGGPTPTPDPQQTAEAQESDSDPGATPTATASPQPQPDDQTLPTETPSVTPVAEPPPQTDETPLPTPEDGKMSVSEAARLLDAQEEEEMDVRKRFHQLPRVDERTIEKDW